MQVRLKCRSNILHGCGYVRDEPFMSTFYSGQYMMQIYPYVCVRATISYQEIGAYLFFQCSSIMIVTYIETKINVGT